MDENGTIIEVTTQLLLWNIWNLHSLLLSLTSNRGPQFILEVYFRSLLKKSL